MINGARERIVVNVEGILRLGSSKGEDKIEFSSDDTRTLKSLLSKVDDKRVKIIVSNVEDVP